MQKRKTNLRFLIFTVILAILISSDVWALETQNATIQEQVVSIDELQSTILRKIDKSTGLENIKEYTNIDIFVSMVKNIYPTMTDVELAQEIMRATGDDEETISKTPENKKLEILNCISVTQVKSFFIESKDAEAPPIQVDESTFYQHVREVKAKQNNLSLNTDLSPDNTTMKEPLPEEEWTDGCLLVKSNAYKIPRYTDLPGRDVFVIRATAEWLTYPIFKGIDRLAIASAGQKDNRYSPDAMAEYTFCDKGAVSETYEYVHKDFPEVYGLKLVNDSIYGVSVRFDLQPLDSPEVITYKKLDRISLWYGITTQHDVTSQVSYAHATYGLGGINVSLSPSGISFSAPITQGWQEFKLNTFTLYYNYPYN